MSYKINNHAIMAGFVFYCLCISNQNNIHLDYCALWLIFLFFFIIFGQPKSL